MYFLDATNFSQFKPTKTLSFKNHQKKVIMGYYYFILGHYY